MARRIIIASILLAIFLGAPLAICGAEQEYHVIQTGETLYSIAKSYSIPFEMLANINGITDPSKIRPGIVLLIPQVHVVGKGETYYGIAKKYDISIQELKTANNLSDSYVLRVGDVLIIPEQSSASTAVAQSLPSTTTVAPVSASAMNSSPSVAPTNSFTGSNSSAAPAVAAAPKGAAPPVQPTAPQPSAVQTSTPQPSAPEKPQTQPAATSPAASSPAQPTSATPASISNAPQSSGTSQGAEKTDGQDKNPSRATDTLISWPVEGKGHYMSGKLEGIMFQTKRGAAVQAVASGTVVSAGPSRGFGQVVFIQSKSGFVYVYGGNESILVKTGESIAPGKTIATVGIDSKDGSPTAYFFVFRNGQPVDPSLAPRE